MMLSLKHARQSLGAIAKGQAIASLARAMTVLTLVAASGCAISPGPEIGKAAFCSLPLTYLSVESPDPSQPMLARTGSLSFADTLFSAFRPQKATENDGAISNSLLFLSGGSQHGAFGAGFLHGWASERPGGLPRFRAVTGVSTGAIMATHAFLNQTDSIVANYRIRKESDVLRRYVGPKGVKSIGGAITVARRGAVGDLLPMRSLLGEAISDDVLVQVAHEADAGRKLYVGAVDVDLGKAAIFNMTAMAQRFRAADGAARKLIKACYLDAIVASSSVPLAARPTFIDNRMYIDGGARFGVISDEIGDAADAVFRSLKSGPRDLPRPTERPKVYVIINGTLEVDEECGKADLATCSQQPPVSPVGAHKNWNLLDLASRSVSILINQVYRFSADRIYDQAKAKGYEPHLVRIESDLTEFSTPIDWPGTAVSQTCPVWEQTDEEAERPLEFHPRYMRCLIVYGAEKAKRAKWGCSEPIRNAVSDEERARWAAGCEKAVGVK
jgi:hypothetical protein